MNELQLFKNEKLNLSVRAIYNDGGSISVSAEDCARGLGFVDKSKSATSGAQLEKVRWARINKYLNEFGVSQQVAKGDFIPESVFYLLAMKPLKIFKFGLQMMLSHKYVKRDLIR